MAKRLQEVCQERSNTKTALIYLSCPSSYDELEDSLLISIIIHKNMSYFATHANEQQILKTFRMEQSLGQNNIFFTSRSYCDSQI